MTAGDDRVRAGLTCEATSTVTADMRPPHLDGILATSRRIGLVENTCLQARVGEEVRIRVRLTAVPCGLTSIARSP